jgi:SAM-dependent methyltransferase
MNQMDVLRDPFIQMPLETAAISRDRLNIDGKERSNLFPWNGQFSPQLIEALLQTYARSGDFILDPFLGSGTVLCEAGRVGLPCFGTEINPAAFKMARTYRLINFRPDERKMIVQDLDTRLQEALPDTLPLMARDESDADSTGSQRALTDLSASLSEGGAKILLDALIVLLDFYKNDLTAEKVFDAWDKLKATVKALPFSEAAISLANTDARALPLPDAAVDLVLTSPPYINVFNYHQQYRASVEALGWDLLEVARSEIGSNRKHRGNRFLTVIQYCLDMTDVLIELKRVCKEGARIIVVVGRESNVRKTRFYNGEIVAALGVRCAGVTPRVRQERVFKNKFGTLIYEDILHFTNDGGEGEVEPLDIARGALISAMAYAPDESKGDLEAALEGAAAVGRSPLYVPGRTSPIRTPF